MMDSNENIVKQQVRVGVAVFIIKDDQILVGKRLSNHGKGTWALPGGHLEFGETPEQCAIREVFEETGLTITNPSNAIWTNDMFLESNKHYITLFLVAKYDHGIPKVLEPDKCSEWIWSKLSDIPEPMFKGLDTLINGGLNIHKLYLYLNSNQ